MANVEYADEGGRGRGGRSLGTENDMMALCDHEPPPCYAKFTNRRHAVVVSRHSSLDISH
jgi:hypothetical protein